MQLTTLKQKKNHREQKSVEEGIIKYMDKYPHPRQSSLN